MPWARPIAMIGHWPLRCRWHAARSTALSDWRSAVSEGPAEREFQASDGTVASFSSPQVIAERSKSYVEWLGRVRAERPAGHEFVQVRAEPRHWKSLAKPLSESTVALVTTGGVHHCNQDPFDVYEELGDWTSRPIPGDIDTSDLTVTHTHYATQDALEDVNVMFPLDRLRELVDQGVVGGVSPLHFGFMGFIPDPAPLVRETALAAAAELFDRGVDVVVLTAG
ncbi:MAG: hypothetical protein GEU73_11080 [Chloroflexi bacterium]|nr:hypothetical protein [Chloroflexota bacterium]